MTSYGVRRRVQGPMLAGFLLLERGEQSRESVLQRVRDAMDHIDGQRLLGPDIDAVVATRFPELLTSDVDSPSNTH